MEAAQVLGGRRRRVVEGTLEDGQAEWAGSRLKSGRAFCIGAVAGGCGRRYRVNGGRRAMDEAGATRQRDAGTLKGAVLSVTIAVTVAAGGRGKIEASRDGVVEKRGQRSRPVAMLQQRILRTVQGPGERRY